MPMTIIQRVYIFPKVLNGTLIKSPNFQSTTSNFESKVPVGFSEIYTKVYNYDVISGGKCINFLKSYGSVFGKKSAVTKTRASQY